MGSTILTMNSDHGIEQAGVRLVVEPDREHAVYGLDERFEFVVRGEGVASVPYTIQWDDGREVAAGEVALHDGEARISAVGDRPGVLQAHLKLDEETATACGVAIDPLAIKPSMGIPDDFDAFWDAQIARLAEVPLNFTTETIKSEAIFSVGLLDPTCKPSSVLSAFNCFEGAGTMYLEPFAPHCGTPEGTAKLDGFIEGRVAGVSP